MKTLMRCNPFPFHACMHSSLHAIFQNPKSSMHSSWCNPSASHVPSKASLTLLTASRPHSQVSPLSLSLSCPDFVTSTCWNQTFHTSTCWNKTSMPKTLQNTAPKRFWKAVLEVKEQSLHWCTKFVLLLEIPMFQWWNAIFHELHMIEYGYIPVFSWHILNMNIPLRCGRLWGLTQARRPSRTLPFHNTSPPLCLASDGLTPKISLSPKKSREPILKFFGCHA